MHKYIILLILLLSSLDCYSVIDSCDIYNQIIPIIESDLGINKTTYVISDSIIDDIECPSNKLLYHNYDMGYGLIERDSIRLYNPSEIKTLKPSYCKCLSLMTKKEYKKEYILFFSYIYSNGQFILASLVKNPILSRELIFNYNIQTLFGLSYDYLFKINNNNDVSLIAKTKNIYN